MTQKEAEPSLTKLLDRIDKEEDESGTVSFRQLMERTGQNAITPLILLVAVLMVSPLSGVPGTPTVAALIIVTMTVQALSGRKRLWLPDFLMRRRIRSRYLHRAVAWLRRPCAFLDRHSQERLAFLAVGPMRWVTLGLCALIPLTWPLLEILPMVTSFGATVLSLLVFGLFTKDGVYVLLGYGLVALSGLSALTLV